MLDPIALITALYIVVGIYTTIVTYRNKCTQEDCGEVVSLGRALFLGLLWPVYVLANTRWAQAHLRRWLARNQDRRQ